VSVFHLGELGVSIHQVVSSAGDFGITSDLAGSDQPFLLYAPRCSQKVARIASLLSLVAMLTG
jgi:hypothetical protein